MLGFELEGEEWKDDAACKDKDSSLFFHDVHGRWDYSPAIAICNTCDVTVECLDYAIRNGIRHGVWGGHAGRSFDRVRKLPRHAR